MTTVFLLAYVCLSNTQFGYCTDHQVYRRGSWSGPDAMMLCEEEAAASRRRLFREGYGNKIEVRCEQQ